MLGYKQGYVVPFVSVYGRSGAGKSVIVKFVCENLEEISYVFVNLRQAKTVFGAANLILAELGQPNLKSAQGINLAVEKIGDAIKSVLKKDRNLFVLVLDEYDVIFYDKRGRPSDFLYKLIVLEEKLRQNGLLLCIIGISNNVLSDYDLDDRVRSRIGSSEVFFEPYSKSDVLGILEEKASKAFSEKIDDKVLEHCANLSSSEHGDARRAIDLLRVAAELANTKGEKIAISHVEAASEELQKDRVSKVLSTGSFHLIQVFIALARLTYLTDEPWQSTSLIYKQYRRITEKEKKPLSYRRISELLNELENTGLTVSQTSSKGRHGYGTQYKLTIPPDIAGILNSDMLKSWQENKAKYYNLTHEPKSGSSAGMRSKLNRLEGEKNWRKYVGID